MALRKRTTYVHRSLVILIPRQLGGIGTSTHLLIDAVLYNQGPNRGVNDNCVRRYKRFLRPNNRDSYIFLRADVKALYVIVLNLYSKCSDPQQNV
jgi:hypothetical protein